MDVVPPTVANEPFSVYFDKLEGQDELYPYP